MHNPDKKPNALVNETSPYLLQHAWNPVHWLPWGPEALSQARAEQKLLIISIGYSACHWCHVMEKECFEDTEVAALMNRYYIPVKVDREERPDVDMVYMDAVQLMRGQGGWPLNVICLPDGTPIYGGTYFPKPAWLRSLQQIQEIWQHEPDKAKAYGRQLLDGLASMDTREPESDDFIADQNWLDTVLTSFRARLDIEHGGIDKAPKFPMPATIKFMLEAGFANGSEDIVNHVHHTLRRMASGGIYDAVGGGFARYSVDKIWMVPHFEKMLYDNAQLISVYADAYRHKPEPEYESVIRETIDWIQREMTGPEGLIYAAMDADSEGIEGKYYTWTWEEWHQVLGADAGWAAGFWNITPEGNWEHSNILYQTVSVQELALQLNFSPDEANQRITKVKHKLLKARSARIRPGLDDKRLLSWNALAVQAFIHAFKALGEDKYRQKAMQIAQSCLDTYLEDGFLKRTSSGGSARIDGLLEDYALLSEALLSVAEVDSRSVWVSMTRQLVNSIRQHFMDAETGLCYVTADFSEALITRKKELIDNVIPSANSVLAHTLRTLWMLTGEQMYFDWYKNMLRNVMSDMNQYPTAYANWCRLGLYEWMDPEMRVVIRNQEKYLQLISRYAPGNVCYLLHEEQFGVPLWEGKYHSGNGKVFVCNTAGCRTE